MHIIFEVDDKTGRKIRLTKRQWAHVRQGHPEIEDVELIKSALASPIRISQPYQGKKFYYYRYCKNGKFAGNYLMVVVKYLNGHGFVISAFYVANLR
jgi:hypothetical protein